MNITLCTYKQLPSCYAQVASNIFIFEVVLQVIIEALLDILAPRTSSVLSKWFALVVSFSWDLNEGQGYKPPTHYDGHPFAKG